MTLDRLHTLLALLTAIVLTVAATACAGEGGEEPSEPTTWYQTGFYLTVGEQNTTSRAPSDGVYDAGSGYENYVDLDNVQVHLYDPQGNYSGPVEEYTVTPLGESAGGKRYKIEGRTRVDISSGRFKVVVLANWPRVPGGFSFEALWRETFDFEPGEALSETNLIPLYGVKDVVLANVNPGIVSNFGTIHLLRAVAKIEVVLDDPEDFWYLKSLRLTNHNTRGYCAPQVMSQSDYVKDSWDQDYVGRAFVPEDAGRRGELDFVKIADRATAADRRDRYLLYVPEYYNSQSGTPQAQISVEFENSTTGVTRFPFRHPVTGRTMDLMRNLWYKITIRKKDENSAVRFEVDVIPYKVVELDPIFGLTPTPND